MPLYLREDCKADLATVAPELARALPEGEPAGARALYDALAQANGVVYRQAARRRTVRLDAAGGCYFAKLHDGVGWREIAKNLLVGKRPVLGAGNEFAACRQLAAHGVNAPRVAAFGAYGRNPARRRSFLVCDALNGMASLEELTASGDLPPVLRHRLIVAAGDLLRVVHDVGVHHRDCYLAHIFADVAEWEEGRPALAIIDLHRAWVRRPLPRRWRRRDLAALLVSAAPLRLTGRELLRFAAAYTDDAKAWRRDGRFWRGVLRRAKRLRRRSARRGRPATGLPATGLPATGLPATGLPAETAASVTDFHALDEPPTLPFRFDVDLPSGPARAHCTALRCWRPRREFTARATIDGEERLLRVFFGFGRTRRFRRAGHVARRLTATGVGPPVLEAGRCNGARLLVYPVDRPACQDRRLADADSGVGASP